MKLIVAYVRPHKVDEVTLALRQVPDLNGVSTSEAKGWGRAKREAEKEHHSDRISDFDEYVRFEVCCADATVDSVIDTILSSAKTGLLGDGKIFVCPVLEAIRIRTEERGEDIC